MNKKIIEIEKQRGLMQILLVLHNNGETMFGKLYCNKSLTDIGNNITAERAINVLMKHNLVNLRITKGSKAKYYSLTNKGVCLANIIKEMDKILNEK